MTRNEALRLLGLNENASEADIRVAYKELAQILHPDKFAGNKKLSERASEQFKRVNEARDLLLGRGSTSRRGRWSGRGSYPGSGESDVDSARDQTGDQAAVLRARLAGIAAAQVQLTSQLNAELGKRRLGLYLTIGGIIALLLGRVIKPLLAIAPVAVVWGAVQLLSSLATIKIIKYHLGELERSRQNCERELEKL